MTDEFVIDNSVVMTWCFKDEASPYADAVLDRLEFSTGWTPSIWPLEVCNVLLVAERKKRMSAAAGMRFLALLSELPIMIEQEPPERILGGIFALAREHGLSSYDASYLDLAIRKGLPIATLDKKLMAAAEQSGVILLND